jgi:Asp-tRNA(Asn)/Glu-tRNA(Gln) amidotransferase A subunit family amidase
MGLQLCAPLFAERPLLAAAHAYEQKTKHALKHELSLDTLAAPSGSL